VADKSDLLAEQAPIDRMIADELILATPEWWESALLEVRASRDDQRSSGLAYTISSPDGLSDHVEATEEIQGAVLRLAQLHARRGHPWRCVRYHVRRRHGSDDWDTQITFEYWSQ